jgi:predicted ATPase/DNA-binding SARP family transcriptional activator
MWTIRLLGGLAAAGPQQVVTRFRTQKAASLLAYLAFHAAPGAPARPRELLLELLWPEAGLDAGRHNLSNALSVLRRVLESAGVAPGTIILAEQSTVRLNPSAVRTDVAAFEEAVARAADPNLAEQERMTLLLQAAELYRGPLLPGFYEDWISLEAARLDTVFLRAVAQLVPLLLSAGELDAALAHARRAVETDPFSEETTQQLMQVLSAAGAPSQARRIYELLEQRLREIGEAPSPALQAYAAGLRSAGRLPAARVPLPARVPTKWAAAPERAGEVATKDEGRRANDEGERSEERRGDAAKGEPAGDKPASPSPLALSPLPPSPFALPPSVRLRGAEFALLTTTQFFDRESETAQLAALLAAPRTRLVTLTGPGGIGKTRLAIELAARLVLEGGELRSAVFLSLVDLVDPGRLLEVVLRGLEFAPVLGRDVLDQVADTLASRPGTLLLLDNFEQLAEEGAGRVRALLGRAPEAKVLVTSRQRLRIEAEHEFQLAPLPTAGGARSIEDLLSVPSISLFVDRAQAASPAFELTERNHTAIAELCDRLEGIPLAIELAAARVTVLSPERILEQVSANRLDFLASRRRDVDSRHRTLRATLDWSYRLLPEPGQQFLARLSVFRGGWTLEAAAAVCGEPTGVMECSSSGVMGSGPTGPQHSIAPTLHYSTLDLLTELRDSSLIGVVDTTEGLRFSMLETVREYGAEQLEQSGQHETVCERHAAYFAALAEAITPSLLGPEALETMRVIGREQENFRATLRWADAHPGEDPRLGYALARHWIRLASWEQEIRWLTGLRGEGAGEEMSEPLANLMFALGGLTSNFGDLAEATHHLAEVVHLFLREGETVHAAWALLWMTHLAFERSVTESRRYAEEALSLMRRDGTAVGVGSALTGLARLYSYQGEHERALEAITEAIGLLQDRPDPVALGNALLVAGRNRLMVGDLAAARTHIERNIALRRRIGDRPGVGVALQDFGRLALSEGEFGAAERLLEEALPIYEEARWDTSVWAATALYYLGVARLGLRKERQAECAAREALTRFRQRKSLFGARICLHLLADLAGLRGQTLRAARLLGACEAMRVRLGGVLLEYEAKQVGQLRARLLAEFGEERLLAEEAFGASLSEDEVYALGLEEAQPAE